MTVKRVLLFLQIFVHYARGSRKSRFLLHISCNEKENKENQNSCFSPLTLLLFIGYFFMNLFGFFNSYFYFFFGEKIEAKEKVRKHIQKSFQFNPIHKNLNFQEGRNYSSKKKVASQMHDIK